MIEEYQQRFIDTAIQSKALCFGEFTLKSGRVSPYFFNAGRIFQGKNLSQVAKSYADAIVGAGISFDVLFGPAYKGISLSAITACALFEQHGIDKPYAYNRKEAKQHGEGGALVGAPVQGKRVLIIDDVITAGTAIRQVREILLQAGAEMAGVVVGLDREEKGTSSSLSAIQEIEGDFAIPVCSIIGLGHIITYMETNQVVGSGQVNIEGHLEKMKSYQLDYGVK